MHAAGLTFYSAESRPDLCEGAAPVRIERTVGRCRPETSRRASSNKRSLRKQARDLAEQGLEAYAAILEVRLVGRDEHGVMRKGAGEGHGFRKAAAGHDG